MSEPVSFTFKEHRSGPRRARERKPRERPVVVPDVPGAGLRGAVGEMRGALQWFVMKVFTAGFVTIGWLVAFALMRDAIDRLEQHADPDPFRGDAWAAVLGFLAFTAMATAGIGLLLERWPKIAAIRLVPPVLTVVIAIAIVWLEPHAGIALEGAAVVTVAYLAYVGRTVRRDLRRARAAALPEARVRR